MKHPRLLLMAATLSLTAHVALIGGTLTRHRGVSGHSPESVDTRKVRVNIRREPPESGVFTTKKTNDPLIYGFAQKLAGPLKAVSESSNAVSAQRLLADPGTGIIFSVYFKTIRARLSRAAFAQKIKGKTDSQSAAARFVLDKRGRIVSSAIFESTSTQAAEATENILRAAAPFPPFPSAIRHEAISFDIRFRFDAD